MGKSKTLSSDKIENIYSNLNQTNDKLNGDINQFNIIRDFKQQLTIDNFNPVNGIIFNKTAH